MTFLNFLQSSILFETLIIPKFPLTLLIPPQLSVFNDIDDF